MSATTAIRAARALKSTHAPRRETEWRPPATAMNATTAIRETHALRATHDRGERRAAARDSPCQSEEIGRNSRNHEGRDTLYGTTGATTSRKTPVRRLSAALLMRIVVLAPAAYTGIKSADCDYARSKRIE